MLPRQAYWWHKILDFICLFCFNWRIIALQYCVSFCHTSTWISHGYTHVPSLWNLPPASHPIPPPSRLPQSTGFELPASHSKFLLAIYLTYGNVYVSMLLFQFCFYLNWISSWLDWCCLWHPLSALNRTWFSWLCFLQALRGDPGIVDEKTFSTACQCLTDNILLTDSSGLPYVGGSLAGSPQTGVAVSGPWASRHLSRKPNGRAGRCPVQACPRHHPCSSDLPVLCVGPQHCFPLSIPRSEWEAIWWTQCAPGLKRKERRGSVWYCSNPWLLWEREAGVTHKGVFRVEIYLVEVLAGKDPWIQKRSY